MNNKPLMKRLGVLFMWALMVITTGLQVAHAQSSTKTTYFHTDHLGSIVAATDEQGDFVWRKTYDPYGNEVTESRNGNDLEEQTYTGKPFDEETGLVYLGQRYCDSEIRRFMGIDPVGFRVDAPVSFNRYAYANNNPYRFVDPDGRAAIAVEGNIQLSGWVAARFHKHFGDKNAVQFNGYHFGLAVSFPTSVEALLGEDIPFDLGIFGGINIPIADVEVGKASIDLGSNLGGFKDLQGESIETSVVVGRNSGGLLLTDDGDFSGFKVGRGVAAGKVISKLARLVEKLPDGKSKALGKLSLNNNFSSTFKHTKVVSVRGTEENE